ncbi:SDR family oxidoreductase [Saccharopolyspora indica]|uniref:SDR family oxidoreductase n=1 Tax=Saccharopolyspora indica TaxID=1229659 RepID=UPI0022EB41EE|nr:SDR family oxidoreductase [Saccharopolyspora indica]MDA3648117.1 SDR family oxidoreductase [Saccharopolyspora indica]
MTTEFSGALAPRGSTAVVLGDSPGCATVLGTLIAVGVEVEEEARGTAPDICVAVLTGSSVLGSRSRGGLPRQRLAAIADRMAERGTGRMVLVTDAGGGVHTGADPSEAADRAADLAWWRHLAARSASRGVVANQIRVGLAPFLSHELEPVRTGSVLQHLPLRRVARPGDLACALVQLISTGCAYTVGETLPLDGGLTLNLIPPLREPKPWTPPREPEAALADRFSLAGRTALVIGASSGIGAESAAELARRGADVVLVARREPELRAVAERIGGRPVVADVRDTEAILDSVDGIDLLVYAAGVFGLDGAAETRARSMEVNFRAYAEICDALVDRWRESGTRGSIVGVCSVGAEVVPVQRMESYGASKAAMVQYTRCLAVSAGRDGIRANCVAPGIVDTPMSEWVAPAFRDAWTARIPLGSVGTPPDVASFVAFLASDAASHVTGSLVHVDGGFTLGGLPPLGEQ